MTRFQISSAVAALAIATTAAAAQTAPPPGVAQGTAPAPMAAPHPPLPPLAPGAPQVRVLVGGDHAMTRAEVSQHIGKMFARLDTNHDGFITREEVDALHSKMEGAMAHAGDFEKRLADRGVFIGDRGAMFDRLDANHDGNISRQEFMAGKPELRQERVMIMRDGAPVEGGMHGMRGMGMHRMGMGALGGRMFEQADANRDGRVSLAEAQAMALAHFDKADLNHDGKITPEERAQGHVFIMRERRKG
jgi:hypothetical protein